MEIKKYSAIILRRWWIIAISIVLCGVVAFLVSKNSQPIYGASARLLIDQPPGDQTSEYNQFLLEQRLAPTYVEIIKMRPVLEETIDILNLSVEVDDFGDMISVSTLRDTQIIEILVEDTIPLRAAAIANTIGLVFIDQNSERESLRFSEPISNSRNRLEAISAEQSDLETMLAESELDETQRRQIESQLADLQNRYNDTLENHNAILAEEARQSSNVVMLEEAKPTSEALRPRVLRTTILAIVVGALVGLIIVFLLDYLDDTVKDPSQSEYDTGLPVLGNIGIIKGANRDHGLITHKEPRHPISEAYRTLRTNLNFAAVNGDLKSILISSSSPSEGKSTTVANLAVVLAQQGKKVVVVDADLRRSSQHRIFEVDKQNGLTTALVDQQTPVMQHVHLTQITNLYVMPSGSLPPNPADLLGSLRMKTVIETLSKFADVVIYDSPPILNVSDAVIIAPYIDICLLVALFGKTKRNDLSTTVKQLEASKSRLYGIVFNTQKFGRGYYSYHYYKGRQDYEYSIDGKGSTVQANVVAMSSETQRGPQD